MIPQSPDALLTRNDAAAALSAAGYPITPGTLRMKACRGGGPAYRVFGRFTLYRWADLLAWAESRAGTAHTSASERRNAA